jgi:hypothetical protein
LFVPGPIPIPFLGTLIQIARAAPYPHLAFPVLSKRYGDIYSVKFGRHDYGELKLLKYFRNNIEYILKMA